MKYYMITNEEEIHNGLQYHTGLNVDILPFNPSCDCEPGGIYFAREDILAFLNYGPWIREVTIPEGEKVYECLGYPRKYKAHSVILGDRERITHNTIARLLNEGANKGVLTNDTLWDAAENGWLDVVKCLVNGPTSGMYKDISFYVAAANNQHDVVKYLIEHGANLHVFDELPLWAAIRNGHLDMVKFLIDNGADIHTHYDTMLSVAMDGGQSDIVKYLVEYRIDKIDVV